MALTELKLIQTSGAPGGGEQVMQSSSWGVNVSSKLDDGTADSHQNIIGAGTNSHAAIDLHIASVANPHAVTAVQVGAAPVAHVTDTANPHSVTKTQVGLANVTDDAQIIKAIGTLKGDIIVYTASNTPIRLPVGADTFVLTADPAEASGMKWAAGGGGGGTPGGADTQVQFNDAAAFGGMAAMTYNKTTGKVTLNAGAVAEGNVEILKDSSGTACFIDVSLGQMSIGDTTIASGGSISLGGGLSRLATKETVVPGTPTAGYGYWYTKSDNKAYFTDGAGAEHTILLDAVSAAGSNTQVQYNNAGAFGGMDAMTYNNSTRKIILNAGAVTGGDVEIKTLTTGTTFFADVSTGFIGIGTDSPQNLLHTQGTGFLLLERLNDGVTINSALVIKKKSSINMVDGYGAGIAFFIEDDAVVENAIGKIGFERNGADNEGKFVLFGGTNGGETFFTIDSAGKSVMNPSALAGGDVEIKTLTTGTTFFADVSTGFVGIGTNLPTLGVLHVVGNSAFERQSAQTTGVLTSIEVVHDTSGNMVDGFGAQLRYGIRDSSNVHNIVGHTLFVRDGADNEGKYIIQAGTDGEEEFLSIDKDGLVNINQKMTPTLFEGSGGNQFTRTTASTNTSLTNLQFQSISSGDMTNGFGSNIVFTIKDNAVVQNFIGQVGFVRDGADNEGKFVVKNGTNGVEERFAINAIGETFMNLPTSAGATGSLWADSGTVKVA